MKDLKLDRRHMLSGGMASASLLSAKGRRTPQAVTNDALGPAGGQPQFIGDEASLWAGEHAPFRAAFLTWLEKARDCFPMPVSAVTADPTVVLLNSPDLHPALTIMLESETNFAVLVNYDDVFWGSIIEFSMLVGSNEDGTGWHDYEQSSEHLPIYPTRDACWEQGFELLLDWFNHDYVTATHLVLFGRDGHDDRHWGAARLARDGVLLRTGRVKESRRVRHLLPLQHVRKELSA